MKKIVLILIITFIGFNSQAQIPNPVDTGLLKGILMENISQTSFNSILKRLEEKGLKLNADTFKEIQKVQEGLKTVNNLIKTGKEVKEITTYSRNIGNLYLEMKLNINSHPMIGSYDRKLVNEMANILMSDVFKEVEDFKLYTANNKIKLSDFERINLLKKISDIMHLKYRTMDYLYKKVMNKANERMNDIQVLEDYTNSKY